MARLVLLSPFGGDPVDHNHASYWSFSAHSCDLLSFEQQIAHQPQHQMGICGTLADSQNNLTYISQFIVQKPIKSNHTHQLLIKNWLKKVSLTAKNSQK